MKQVMKRSLSVLLCAVLLFGSIAQWNAPLTANAASNPYDYNATDANGNWANCTWWAWQLAYDNTGVALPAWGNAKNWYSKAQAAGYSCDTTPSANSIACQVSGTYGHVMFVTAVDGNRIYVKQGGYRGTSNGYHEGWTSTSDVIGYIHLAQAANTCPNGALDSLSGGEGSFFITGWAYDPDETNKNIEIHVYIGGPAGSSDEMHGGIIANVERGDVDNAFHCGAYHGFSARISTNKRGSQPVYVYAIDSQGGHNPCIGSGTVTINSPTYTLTYNANGGTGAPSSQTGNGNITLSNTKPTRSGYTFKGWATSASATTAQYSAGASYNLTGNATLYAVWQKNATHAQPTVKAVALGDVTINYKATTTLKPQITADEGAKYTVSYFSSNPNVASVDANGKVTGVKKGTAVITCTVTDQTGNTVSDTCTVTVSYTVWQWIIKILLFGWLWY